MGKPGLNTGYIREISDTRFFFYLSVQCTEDTTTQRFPSLC